MMKKILAALALAMLVGAGSASAAGPVDAARCAVKNLAQGTIYMCELDVTDDATVQKVVWAVECAGYALGGNPCTGPASADSGIVECAKAAAREAVKAVTGEPWMPQYCEISVDAFSVETSGGVVDCVKGGARALVGALQGYPQPYACELATQTESPVDGVVDCVKGGAAATVRALLGEPAEPYACQLSTEDPTAGARDCVKGAARELGNWLTGRPYMPYACEL